MRRLRAVIARIAGTFAGRRADDELREELESHLEMEIADLVRRGVDPDTARRRALTNAGGLTVAAEAVRDQRRLPWLDGIAADLRYAARALRNSPGFTAVVVLTLGLGIGANTAIFSVVRGVLLKPLPHRDGDRLVYLRQSADGPGGASLAFSVPEVTDLRTGTRAFSGIAEYSSWSLTLREPEGATRLDVGLVTGNYFDVMGLSPVLGRVTRPSDDGSAAPAVMVLTYEFWMKHFGGDPRIVGRHVSVEQQSATVIGVLQPAPFFPNRIDALCNMVISPHHLSAQMVQGRTHRMTEIVARLAPGATLADARTQVAGIYARMQREFKDAYDPGAHFRVAVIPLKDVFGERARTTLWLFMAAAAFVMIISVANVVNLTLMRGVRREHELVVRAALGAGTARLRRLLLSENLMLVLMGAIAGIALALGGLRLLVAFAARVSPRADEIRPDVVVLAFTLGLAIVVALLLSYAGALPRDGTFASLIASGARRLSSSARRQRLQRGLVVAQIAVSVVLLAGAGLLTRTMVQLAEVNTGLKTEQVLSVNIPLITPSSVANVAQAMAADADAKIRYDRMQRETRGLPGVVAVGLGSTMPLRISGVIFDVKADGKPLAVGEAMPRADLRTADPEYFRAAGIPLLQGRSFEPTDRFGTARVVVINQMLADRLFPHESPIGKRVAWTGDVLRFTPISGDWRTVVGVVADVRDNGLDAPPRPVMFMPFAQEIAIGGVLVVRSDSNVAQLTEAVTRIVRRIAPASPIQRVATIAQTKEQTMGPRRLNALLVSSFGLLAVIIAAVGIAGVLGFSVSARTNEIGIRMSLGADRGRVQRMILGEGGVLLALGLTIGVAAAFFATRTLSGLLFNVAPHDPTTFAAVALSMVVVGLAACWIPALRASRIDPASAMRST